MKLGLSLPMFTADVGRPLAAAARAAAAGYAGVFAPGSSVPAGCARIVPRWSRSRSCPRPPSRTPTCMGTLVSRASLRPVGVLAKLAAGLDRLSGGKAILGLGAGDSLSRPEHEMFGIPFAGAGERVAVLEETTDALRDLFAGDAWPAAAHVPPIAGRSCRRRPPSSGSEVARTRDRGGGSLGRRVERMGARRGRVRSRRSASCAGWPTADPSCPRGAGSSSSATTRRIWRSSGNDAEPVGCAWTCGRARSTTSGGSPAGWRLPDARGS